MTGLGIAVAFVLLLWCSLLYVPFRWRPAGLYLITPKALAAAYAPFIALIGIALAVVGAVFSSWWIAVPAAVAAAGALAVVARVGAVRPDLAGALGAGWDDQIPAERRKSMITRWWTGRLPASPDPRLRQNVPFAAVPGTGRVLLCDLWQPSVGVAPSGAAMVYLYGSGYYLFDKDFQTRPMFRHLAAQGHVIVDVAYRLFPETGVAGMVADAKRAVAWVRGHAAELGVDPGRIVLAGGSAGGHLSLLAAYAHDDPALTPPELTGTDPQVRAVASLYGQVDLDAMYRHTSQDRSCHPDDPQPDWTAPPPRWMVRLFGDNAARLRLQFAMYGGRCDWLVGGTPSQAPERYAQLSVFHHIHPDCPPTLLMHGTHDEMAPVTAARDLQHRLEQAGVPVSAIYLPHTDHMFDIIAPKWAPTARLTIHVLERFLAVISTTGTSTPAHAAPATPPYVN